MKDDFRILYIGASLDPTRELWPEGPHYNFDGGEHKLTLSYASPTRAEAAAVQQMPCRFALYVEPPTLLLLYQFGSLPWGDAPFHWHRMTDPPPLPAIEQGAHALLSTIMVDTSARGRIVAMRCCTFSALFTLELHSAMRAQAALPPPDPDRAHHQLQRLYARYSSEELAEQCNVRCAGGS